MRVAAAFAAAMAVAALLPLAPRAQTLDVDVCDADLEWFDVTALKCRLCSEDEPPAGKVPDAGSIDVLGNPTRCRCAPGYRRSACGSSDNAECTFKCTSCLSADEAATRDGTACMSCGALDLDKSGRADCVCPDDHALVDTDASGQHLDEKVCVACPAGAKVFVEDSADGRYKADLYTCQRCPPNMVFDEDGVCECVAGGEWVPTGVAELGELRCVDADDADDVLREAPEGLATAVTFSDVITTVGSTSTSSVSVAPSLTFKHIFLRAATHCFAYQTPDDLASCSALANLCVLQHYNPLARVCALYTKLADQRAASINGWAGWPLHMPFIQYAASTSATGILSSAALTQTMSFDAGTQAGTFEFMEFRLVRWALNGTFLGIEELGWQFIYCGGGSQGGITSRPRWLKFGVSYSADIACDLRSLLGSGEPELYELYIVDAARAKELAQASASDGGDAIAADDVTGLGASIAVNADALPTSLYPVPFRDENLELAGDERPNENLEGDTSDDVLGRRFFLYDTVSGVSEAGKATKVIRYADAITLQISSQDSEPSKILPPVLSIHYAERQPSQFEAVPKLAQVTFRMEVQYTTDVSTFWATATAFFAICMILVALLCMVRCFNWQRRATRVAEERIFDLRMLVRGVVYFAGSFGTILFWYVLLFSMYWLLFFKLQDKVFALLPANTPRFRPDYEAHQLLVVLCFIGQLVRVMEIVWEQTSVDVFFTDWEKPRGVAVGEDEEEGGGGRGRDDDDDDRRGGRNGRGGRGGRGGDRDEDDAGASRSSSQKSNPLSIWRTILVANEWSEIQIERKTNLMFSLIVLLALLRGAGLEYIATPQPTVAVLDAGEVNPVLHFANVVWWWLLIAAAQLLWRWAIWERYISEPVTTRFIDVATVAKVSCLIMSDRYHGYYLHCRSPFTYADGSMKELIDQLTKEEEGLTTKRGLDHCPAGRDVQTFELFVPKNWRTHYDNIYRKVVDEDLLARSGGAASMRASGMGAGAGAGVAAVGICPTFGRQRRTAGNSRKLLSASRKLSHFVRAFIDQTDSHFKREWSERTYLMRVFNTPPDMDAMGVGGGHGSGALMYADTEARFEQVLFRGVETDLLIFNILTFAVCDLWFGNTLVSAFLTVLVNELLNYVRLSWGVDNIAAKTLVDDRFLS